VASSSCGGSVRLRPAASAEACGTALALVPSNASPGRQPDGRHHTFPNEREAIDASRLAFVRQVNGSEKRVTYDAEC